MCIYYMYNIIYTHIDLIMYNFIIQYSLLFKSSISNCQLKIFFVCGILHAHMWLYVWHVKYMRSMSYVHSICTL